MRSVIKGLITRDKLPGKIFWLVRILILFLVLLVVVAFIYLNEIGLPVFVKDWLLEYFREKGIAFSFHSAKFVWYRGIIVENPRFYTQYMPYNIAVESQSIDILPSIKSIIKKKPELEKIRITKGMINIKRMPESENNSILFNDVNALIKFDKNRSVIADISCEHRNIRIKLNAQHIVKESGRLEDETHGDTGKEKIRPFFEKLFLGNEYLSRCNFDIDSKVEISIKSDTSTNSNLYLSLKAFFPLILTDKFGAVKNLRVSVDDIPLENKKRDNNSTLFLKFDEFSFKDYIIANLEGALFLKSMGNGIQDIRIHLKNDKIISNDIEIDKLIADIRSSVKGLTFNEIVKPINFNFSADELKRKALRIRKMTCEGSASNIVENVKKSILVNCVAGNVEYYGLNISELKLIYDGLLSAKNRVEVEGNLLFCGNKLRSTNFQSGKFCYEGNIKYNLSNALPSQAEGLLKLSDFETRNWGIKQTRVNVAFERDDNVKYGKQISFIDILNSSKLVIKTEFIGIKTTDATIDRLNGFIESHHKDIVVRELLGDFPSGKLRLSARIDRNSNLIESSVESDIGAEDLTKICGLNLPFRKHMDPKSPVNIRLNIMGSIPDFNQIENLSFGNIAKTFKYSGECRVPVIKIEKKEIQNLNFAFDYSKDSLVFKSLSLILNKSFLKCNGKYELKNKNIQTKFSALVNPADVFYFLDTTNSSVANLISNNLPIELDGEFQAGIDDFKNLEHFWETTNFSLKSKIMATNFVFRNKFISEFRCNIDCSGKKLILSDVELKRIGEAATAEKIVVDFEVKRVNLVNARGNLSPKDLAEAIGDDVKKALEPFKFIKSPTVTANGSVPMHGSIGDIEFDIFAPGLEWWRLSAQNASVKIAWKNETVTLKNFYSDFYSGSLNLSLYVDFSEKGGTNLYYNAKISNVKINAFLCDILKKSQKIDGVLDGEIEISSSSITNYNAWAGNGRVTLEDGLIWDVPVFGIFSPILNTVSPGLGNSRANFASAVFVVTNGIVATDNLEIRSRAIKMKYAGTVDFDKRIDARVEAELLRDVWLVGPAIRFLLKPLTKLFIYKVSGTIDKPVSEPLFIPKILLVPFHPFKTIKDYIFPSKDDGETK